MTAKAGIHDEDSGEERCLCGNLIAIRTKRGIEILCRRCKRTHCISWKEAGLKESTSLH